MLLFIGILCLSLYFSLSQPKAPHLKSHCLDNETTLFSCKVKQTQKIISICGSKNLTGQTGYMKYRYGSPEKIEEEYPKENKHPHSIFEVSFYSRAYQADDLITTEISLHFDARTAVSIIESYTVQSKFIQVSSDYTDSMSCMDDVMGSLMKVHDLELQ